MQVLNHVVISVILISRNCNSGQEPVCLCGWGFLTKHQEAGSREISPFQKGVGPIPVTAHTIPD